MLAPKIGSPLRRSGVRFLLCLCTVLPALPLIGQTADQEQLDMYFRVGAGTLRQKRYADAEMAFRKILNASPCHAQGLLGMAETHFAQAQNEQAIHMAEAVATECSGHADALQAAGDIFLRAAKFDLAAVTFRNALELTPATLPAAGLLHFRLAEAYRQLNNREEWGKSLAMAGQTLKDNPSLLVANGLYQDVVGQKEKAMSFYRQALGLEPNNPQALNNLAFLITETGGDLDTALDMAKRARNMLPESAEAADTLGWIYARKRWSDVAVMLLKSALQKDPGNKATRQHLVEALELKEQGAAGRELKAALKAPSSPENDEKIKQLLLAIN
jgi:Tfp pilus assembly protein PilF